MSLSCLRLAALEGIETNPIQCDLLPNAVYCQICSEILLEGPVLAVDQAVSDIDMIQKRDEYYQGLYNQLFDFINGEIFWQDNCIFCFLVSKLSKQGDLEIDHSSASCTSPVVADYSSCSSCFGLYTHPGSFYCSNRFLPQIEGLCYRCWLPMKVGPHWLHKDPTSFGTDDCCIPQWTGRLFFMLSSHIESRFKLTGFSSKQDYADWLATPSSDDSSYGVHNSVLCLLYLLENAEKKLQENI